MEVGDPRRLRNRFSWGNPRVRIISHMVTSPPCKQASLHESTGLEWYEVLLEVFSGMG